MERELKFLLDHAQLPKLPNGYRVARPQPTLHLLDEYLDARGEILSVGWRLRRRRSDGQALFYTLKSERSGSGSGPLTERQEIERSPEQSEEIPGDIVAVLAASGVDTARVLPRLQPYLTLRQERQLAYLLHDDVDFALISLDEVRAAAAPPERTSSWTELEIEFLASTTEEMRTRATREITAGFATQPGVTVGGEAKVDRATRLLSTLS